MAKSSYLGSRLRRLRKDKHLSQVELAAQLGISASYLNLIEHDRRDLTVPILLKISQLLKVDPLLFASQQDGQIAAEVSEAFQDPLFAADDFSDDTITAFTSDFPELSSLLVKLYQAYKTTQGDLMLMQERLSQDSVLADSSFRLRTLVTSILSLTEIMHDNPDLKEIQRKEFLDIVLKDSTTLTETVDEMLGFMGGSQLSEQQFKPSPVEGVTDFIQSQNNYFETIENAADRLRTRMSVSSAPNLMELTSYLQTEFQVSIDYATKDRHDMEISLYDDLRNHLTLSRALPPSSVKFHLALLIGQLTSDALFTELVTEKPELTTEQAQQKAKGALANYFAGAVLFPYDHFYKAAEDCRYDIELLQQQFGASYEQICHRLTTLQRPEKSGVPFHLIRTDVAGNISKRFSASGLRIPRYGSACPRWVVHASLLTPNTICTQISELPDGNQFFSVARTITKPSLGFTYPKRHYAISIGCELSHAHRLIYAENMNLAAPRAIMPVGTTCRLCDRGDCTHRAAPPPAQLTKQRQAGRNISPGIGDW
jgi:predicted transcriptional regulator/transcriptional regulator with XRE-family HTH domain